MSAWDALTMKMCGGVHESSTIHALGGMAAMTSNPWGKFFWNDWENDPALKLCSLAAQGLWMRCLCICSKADPKGYLIVAGRSLTPADLAVIVGRPESEVECLLGELAANGVFSTDRAGRIYSRRMIRDEKKARTARKNGKSGGNPNLIKHSAFSPSDNQSDKGEDNTHKPEARSQKPEKEEKKEHADPDGSGGKPPGAYTVADQRALKPIPEAEVFRRGKEVLGTSAGGLIAKLRGHCGGDLLAVRDLIEQAAAKENPREWIGAVLRGDEQARTPQHILFPDTAYRGVL